MILEVTTQIGCNYNCQYCPQEKLLKAYPKDDPRKLDAEVFREVLVDRSNVPFIITAGEPEVKPIKKFDQVNFSGFCEPFLNEEIYYMIDYCERHEVPYMIYSKGLDIDVEKLKMHVEFYLMGVVLHYPDQENDFSLFAEKSMMIKDICENTTIVSVDKKIYNYVQSIEHIETSSIKRCKGNKRHQGILSCPEGRINQPVLLPNGKLYLCCQDYGLKHCVSDPVEKRYVLNGMKRPELDILCRYCEKAVSCD